MDGEFTDIEFLTKRLPHSIEEADLIEWQISALILARKTMTQNYDALRIACIQIPLATGSSFDDDGPQEQFYTFQQQEIAIGRAQNNDVVLKDLTISRYHARLTLQAEKWMLHNLTARNRLWVNGQAVPNFGFVSVSNEDQILLGNTRLQVMAASLECRRNDQQVAPLVSSISRFRIIGEIITRHLPLPQGLEWRTRFLAASIELLILILATMATLFISGSMIAPALKQYGLPALLPALVVPLIPVAGIPLLMKYLKRYNHQPQRLCLATFFWGAVIALPLSYFIETVSMSLFTLLPGSVEFVGLQAISAGIIEETTKGLGLFLLFLFLREECSTIPEGIIYGALIGAGFALVENFGYFATDAPLLPSLFVGRILLGGFNHSTFTACFGATLGYARQTQIRWKQIAAPLVGYMLAVGLHSFFDFVTFLVGILTERSSNDTRTLVLTAAALMGNYFPLFLAQGTLGLAFLKTLANPPQPLEARMTSEYRCKTGASIENVHTICQDL